MLYIVCKHQKKDTSGVEVSFQLVEKGILNRL